MRTGTRGIVPPLRTLLLASVVACGIVLVTSTASAEATFSLSWRSDTRPGGCATEASLREGVERKLGRAPFASREEAELIIEGRERALGNNRYQARIIQKNRDGAVLGERNLDAQSCAALLRGAILVVALFIDPNQNRPAEDVPAQGRKDEAPPASEDEPPPGRDTPPLVGPPSISPHRQAPLPPAPPAPRSRSKRMPPGFQVSMGLGAGAATGMLPSVNGILLGVGRLSHERSRWSFDWTGEYALPQTVVRRSVRGEFGAIQQQLRTCLGLAGWRNVTLDACGGVVWGAILPETVGVRAQSDRFRVFAGPTAATAVQFRRGESFVRLEAGAMVPQRRFMFAYIGAEGAVERFYSTSPVTFFVALTGTRHIL